MKRLFLIDAYALIYRSYYAFLSRPMRNRQGMNTSAVFGFVKFLRDIIKREQPHYLGVAFDSRGPTFRHEMFAEYKANRQAAPEDIHAAVPMIKEILTAMRIPILEMAGWEADDIIGTLSRHACGDGFEVFMVTPDKDFGQLVNHCAKIYRQKVKGEGIEILGEREICEKYGIQEPSLLIDILALWGDASDNIPGVPGVGEKTACKLVAELGTVDNILANIDKVQGKLREKIVEHREQLLLSRKLAAIDIDAPVPFEPEELVMEEPDVEALKEVYTRLEFTTLLRELDPDAKIPRKAAPKKASTPVVKPSLPADIPHDLFAAEQSYSTMENSDHDYRVVRDTGELEALVRDIREAGRVGLAADVTGVSFSTREGQASCVPWREEFLPLLKEILGDAAVEKAGHNMKADIMAAARRGVEIGGRLWDVMILHYLADPEMRHGLDDLSRHYLGYVPSGAAMERADVSLRIFEKMPEGGGGVLYERIEEPLIRVLADMELAGVRIDPEILGQSGRELNARAAELEKEIREIAGDRTLNVNSPAQLGEALFGRMKIDPKPRLTKTKRYRTDEEYLQSLRSKSPVIDLILEYRGIRKLLSTYIEALPALIDRTTGRVHTSFNQAVTATGRLSSSNPNLQNIPIRTSQGREIRRAFVPADEEHLLLSADYSQVELRIMAHLSGDENLMEAFRKGEDIHTATAAAIFGVPLSEVTPDQRRKAKTANFGIIYGISPFGLSERLRIPREEAREIIESYFRSYPGVKRYIERVVEQARTDGFVSTIFRRRRYLPDIRSANPTVRSFAERNAVNAPIQGSAADVMKLGMIKVWSALHERGLRSRLILQVHDELVVDLYKPEREEVAALVVDAMEHAARLSVALTAECGVGENWLDAH